MDSLNKRDNTPVIAATEREQGMIRVVVAVIFGIYIYMLPHASTTPFILFSPQKLIVPALIYSALMLSSILTYPGFFPARIVIGIVGDLGFVMILMSMTGMRGLPLGVVALWIIMGNGFRFGVRYLTIATIYGALAFLAVYRMNPWWQNHALVFDSQLIGIIVLPLYMAVLLSKLEKLIEAANAANLSKSRFLANMSHELRTPLNGIMGLSELLREHASSRQNELLDTLQGSARHLSDIIGKILDFSRLEAGRMTVSVCPSTWGRASPKPSAPFFPSPVKRIFPSRF